MSGRAITAAYGDPLDVVWLDAAARLGWRVVRSPDAYASWDGRSTLTVSDAAGFDADDSLAQLLFHEMCHALVEGPGGQRLVDWGLDNTSERDVVREHACHRLQAALAGRWGLREFFAVTTDHRAYWDTLPADPLGACDDPAVEPARQAWARFVEGPWRPVLEAALGATARLAAALGPIAGPDSTWARVRPLHALGFPLPPGPQDPARACGGCAWNRRGLCLQARARTRSEWPACERWEARLTAADCPSCGACCREGFGFVPVGRLEPLRRSHPELLARLDDGLVHLPRPGGRCVALAPGSEAHLCTVYAERPRGCRDLEVGGPHCLSARQRVGLSPAGEPVGVARPA